MPLGAALDSLPAIWMPGDTGETPPEFRTETVGRQEDGIKVFVKANDPKPTSRMLSWSVTSGYTPAKQRSRSRKREAAGRAQEAGKGGAHWLLGTDLECRVQLGTRDTSSVTDDGQRG